MISEGLKKRLREYMEFFPDNNEAALIILLEFAMLEGAVDILKEFGNEEHEKSAGGQEIH